MYLGIDLSLDGKIAVSQFWTKPGCIPDKLDAHQDLTYKLYGQMQVALEALT